MGFGPTIWSRTKGETEWGLKGIPLGGYVKIVGMLPPPKEMAGVVDADGSERTRSTNTGLFTQLVADARAAEWELVGPEDKDRLFYKLPWWQKVITMSGGPMVNLVIAFFCFWALFGPDRRGARTHPVPGPVGGRLGEGEQQQGTQQREVRERSRRHTGSGSGPWGVWARECARPRDLHVELQMTTL